MMDGEGERKAIRNEAMEIVDFLRHLAELYGRHADVTRMVTPQMALNSAADQIAFGDHLHPKDTQA